MRLYPTQAKAYFRLRERLRLLALYTAFVKYFCDPAAFARDCLIWNEGEGLAPYQDEALTDFHAHKIYSLDAGRGGGKTFILALAIVWFVITREVMKVQWKCLTTSGSWNQLQKFLWPEIHAIIRRLDWSKIPLAPFTKDQLLTTEINLVYGSAFAKASSDSKLMEGAHAKEMMVAVDEAKSVTKATIQSIEGSLSTGNCYEMLTSTEGDPACMFSQIQAGQHAGYRARHVTLEELIAFLGDKYREWAELMKERTGEDSDFYRNHVLSLPSKAGSNAMFQVAWLEAAADRHRAWRESGGKLEYITSIGSDIASGGGDRSINAIRQAMIVPEFVPASTDTMQALGVIVARLSMNPGASCVYDAINQGVAFRDRGKELGGLNLIPFNGGHKTEMRDEATGLRQYADQRTAGFDHLAWLFNPASNSGIAVEDYREEGRTSLFEQLLNLVMTEESNGKLRVESKRKMRSRLHGESTDAADALMYAFWPEADGVIKKSWWRFWQPAGMKLPPVEVIGLNGKPEYIECVDLPVEFAANLQAWQMCYREDDSMRKYQYVVGQVHAYTATELFIVDQIRERMDFPQACNAMNAVARKWQGAPTALVDLTQNGKQVIQSMRRQVSNIHALQPEGELISRANAVGVAVFLGGVYLPHPGLEGHEWVKGFMQECAEFPNSVSAEQVRALCLGYGYIRGHEARMNESGFSVWQNVSYSQRGGAETTVR